MITKVFFTARAAAGKACGCQSRSNAVPVQRRSRKASIDWLVRGACRLGGKSGDALLIPAGCVVQAEYCD